MKWLWVIVLVALAAYLVYRRRPAKGVQRMEAKDLKELLSNKSASVGVQLLDVREPHEYKSGHVKGFRNIPVGQLKTQTTELERDKPVIVMCHSGMRSSHAARVLVKQGFTDVRNLSGGMMAWNAHRGK